MAKTIDDYKVNGDIEKLNDVLGKVKEKLNTLLKVV